VPDVPRGLAEAPLHLLRRALQAYTAQWQSLCPQVTPPQYAVLLTLRERPTINQTRLGELTGIDTATLTPLLRSLEERGLLSRRTDEGNRRRKLLELTEQGVGVVTQVKGLVAQTDDIMLAGLSPEQRRSLLTALATLAALTER
jgi:DNA-binding MarR family transcriptional regulator